MGVNQRNTYRNRGIANFGDGEYASRGVNLRVNHSNIHGNTRIGNFEGGEYASRGVNLGVNHRNPRGTRESLTLGVGDTHRGR